MDYYSFYDTDRIEPNIDDCIADVFVSPMIMLLMPVIAISRLLNFGSFYDDF